LSASGWRTLGRVFAAGGAFDLTFGIAILAFARPAAGLLGVPLPAERLYLDLFGVLLLVLGGVYLLAARSPEPYRAVAPVAAAGRMLGCIVLVRAGLEPDRSVFVALGLTDLAIGLLTFAAWRRAIALSA
jgi:hypothetical protein